MLTWEYLVDTVRDDLPFILSVGTGCAISASCLEKRKHFYLRVALTLLLAFCWMYGTRPYVGLNMQGTRMGIIRYITAFVVRSLLQPGKFLSSAVCGHSGVFDSEYVRKNHPYSTLFPAEFPGAAG